MTRLLLVLFTTGLSMSLQSASPKDSKAQLDCFDNQLTLWGASFSYSIENMVPENRIIEIRKLTNYVSTRETYQCGGVAYANFSLDQGPICGNGHAGITAERHDSKIVFLLLKGSPSEKEVVQFADSPSATIRRLAAFRLPEFAESTEKRTCDTIASILGGSDPVAVLLVLRGFPVPVPERYKPIVERLTSSSDAYLQTKAKAALTGKNKLPK
jgi:hypothetical protein